MSEKLTIIKPYSEWHTQDLDNEIRFLYIEIGRMGRDASDNINKIREMEAELVNRKIKRIASEEDIKLANQKNTQALTSEEIEFLFRRIEKYRALLKEIESIYQNKKEMNAKSMNAVEIGIFEKVVEILN